MSKELEDLYKLLPISKGLYTELKTELDRCWKDNPRLKEKLLAFRELEQALTPTPLNELRDEIISELNELYDADSNNEDEAWYYIEESYKCGFTENTYYDEIYYYKEKIAPIITMILPLKLAHKIKTYFMRLEEVDGK